MTDPVTEAFLKDVLAKCFTMGQRMASPFEHVSRWGYCWCPASNGECWHQLTSGDDGQTERFCYDCLQVVHRLAPCDWPENRPR